MPYYYTPGTDGCDATFDVWTPEGDFLVSAHYWEEREDAERRAKLIVDALNAYKPKKPRKKQSDFDKVIAKAKASVNANLRKPMPKKMAYKE